MNTAKAYEPKHLRVVSEEERERALIVQDLFRSIDNLTVFLDVLQAEKPEMNPQHFDRAREALRWLNNEAMDRDSHDDIPF